MAKQSACALVTADLGPVRLLGDLLAAVTTSHIFWAIVLTIPDKTGQETILLHLFSNR